MFIITVIPIEKGPFGENLTYFYPTDIPVGNVVYAPLRSKNINAIVVGSEEVLDLKSDIKNADFSLKKIAKVKGESPFDKSFFNACEKMKDYNVSTTGTIIKNLIPKDILENIEELRTKENENEVEDKNNDIKQEKVIFQSSSEERIAFYRTLIRESFAKKESVFICMPTRYDIEIFENELKKGIEQYVFSFHGDLKKKKMINDYNKCISEKHPILIIGTGKFLFVKRNDIKTIILEHESSDSYKQLKRPYLDIRSFVEVLSFIKKTKLILGDTILRPETLWRHEEKELGEISSPIFRLPQIENKILVDMKEETTDRTNKKFAIFAKETKDIIEKSINENKNVFLFTVRKGLAPITICYDCGNTLLCPSCMTPIVLYGSKTSNKDEKIRIFMCNKCGRKEKTETRCPKCNSWNLIPLGIGTERVYEEIKSLYPETPIFQIDKENTDGEKDIKEKIEKFIKSKGAILIGTEMVFSYLNERVSNSIVVSMDGLMSIPSYNMTQKIIHIIEKLHNLTEKNLVIQTRTEDNYTLKQIMSGNILRLYRDEIKERKDYGYPPFKRLIKITFTGTKAENEKARMFINNILGGYDPQIFSAFIGKVKGEYITNTVIKIEPKLWQLGTVKDNTISIHLKDNLSSLPPSFSINVDPEDLL